MEENYDACEGNELLAGWLCNASWEAAGESIGLQTTNRKQQSFNSSTGL